MPEQSFVSNPQSMRDAFKLAMRRHASSVTIITTGPREKPQGMTASAVTSLSADPPSLLVCVNRSASIHAALTLGRRFCVNLLAEQHGELSFLFGGKASPEERFRSGEWNYEEVPYLEDAQSNLVCTVDKIIEYGSHSVVIGRIEAIRLSEEFCPLIYGNGRFIPLYPVATAPSKS